jgi:hypothetical protein
MVRSKTNENTLKEIEKKRRSLRKWEDALKLKD